MKPLKPLLNNKLYLLLLTFLITTSLHAGINLRNGNYHVKYSDIVLKVGEEHFRVDRDYNSHHRHTGIFGYGWTSELESRIKTSDKGLELIEFGITPGILFSKTSSSIFQNAIGETIKIDSNKRYTLNSSNQSRYLFNKEGQLIKKTYPSGYHFVLDYSDKKLSTVRDSFGKQLKFSFSGKKVAKIESSKGTSASYKYNRNLLVNVRNEDGNNFSYDYSANGLLSNIKVQNKQLREIVYDSKTAHVKKIIESNGDISRYDYSSSAKNPMDFNVTVIKKQGTANFHYLLGKRKDGSDFVKSLDFVSNKKKIKTTYSKNCELPIRVEIKDGWEGLTYNKRCRLVRKRDSKGNKLDIKYDEASDTLIKQVKLNKYIVDYQYNERNQPSIIKDSQKREVKISYDLYGRARRVEVKSPKINRKEVLFDYSQNNQSQFKLKVNKKNTVQAYYDENNNIIFDEDINDKVEQEINIVFGTMNYLLNAHKF